MPDKPPLGRGRQTARRIDPKTFVLPCDVKLPPATTIAAGCTLDTLLLAMQDEHRPKRFEDRERKKRYRLRYLDVG